MALARWLPKDFGSICLLLLLYTLQGIPMGLDGSLPLLLLNKISYKQQSLLSLTSLPFSVKLLWAPIVDGVYIKSVGRRRSWLLPLQFAAGLLMIWAANDPLRLQTWIGEGPDGEGEPQVVVLALFFGTLYFLMATQDIAVDGWALTLLSPENRGLASTCNTVGQTLGYCFSYAGFIALNDANFSLKVLGVQTDKQKGVVDLPTFIAFWGWVFVVTTTVILLFFKETDETDKQQQQQQQQQRQQQVLPPTRHVEAQTYAGPISGGEEMHFFADNVLPQEEVEPNEEEGSCEPKGALESYCLLWKLLFLLPVQQLLLVLLSGRAAFAAADAATQLKMLERGVSKEEITLFAPLLMPFGIVCPFLVSKWIKGSSPLKLYLLGFLLRLSMCGVWAAVVAATPYLYGGSSRGLFYVILFLITTLYNVCSDLMFVSMMAFFARVSDPRIGGSYMTFLNTVSNIGSQWPRALSLWLMDPLTIKDCTGVDTSVPGAKCAVVFDGYFVQVGAGILLGFCWLFIFKRRVQHLQQIPLSSWRVSLTTDAAAAAAAELKLTAATELATDTTATTSSDSSRNCRSSSSSSSSSSIAAEAKKDE